MIDEANSVENTSPGSAMTVNVVVNNTGRLNVSDSYDLEVYLSTDTVLSDFDHLIGTATETGVDIGISKNVSVQTTIPTNIIEGTYNLIAVVDSGEVINESNDDDNRRLRTSEVTVGTVATTCGGQNDGGSSTDAGKYIINIG